jgi:capsular polysaccharide biosynthesis protein
LPAHEVARLENVITIGGTRLVVTASGGLLHEEMSAPESEHYGIKLPFVRAHIANRALVHIKIDSQLIEEGALLASDADYNYFHWMLESLPKVELLDAAEISRRIPLLVSQDVPTTGLEALRHVTGERPVKRLRSSTGYRVGQLYMPSDRSRILNNYAGIAPMQNDIVIDPRAIEFLRSRLLSSQPSVPSRKIFLTRGRRHRQLLNEDALRVLLSNLEFEMVDMGARTLKEQVALMSDAAVVISPTGAAVTNIVFAHPAARVLILAPDHPQTNPYLFTQIGSYLGIDVAFAFGERALSITGKYGIHDDYSVDLKSVLTWTTSIG